MTHLKPLSTFDTSDIDPDWMAQLEEQFIQPLAKLGFEATSYGHQYEEETTQGVHTIIFHHDLKTSATMEQIKNLMVDDDSQPYSTFQYYFGTLWLFIPYCG